MPSESRVGPLLARLRRAGSAVTKRRLRLVFLLLILISAAGVGHAWATRESTTSAPPSDGITVVTAQGRSHLAGTGRAVAFGPDGDMMYEHDRYETYFDVDPVEGEPATVEFVAVDYKPPRACPPRIANGTPCSRQLVLRADLRTNETRVVWSTHYSLYHKLHDFDRINETHIVTADIEDDAVHFVNTSSGERTWTWRANESFDYETTGGKGRTGWTHINDVEMVRDGLVMASLRNHDMVVFIDPGEGVVRNLTLGCDDCHDVLYEQHNPDYMPGPPPTVIVADSENNRIVEYSRSDGEWEQRWTWTDEQMHWPRDADRLPNGNTLVTDSHANRVIEVAPNGSIVWSATIGNPYEAERLPTGDESANRPHEPGRQVNADNPVDRLIIGIRGVLPPKPLSGAVFMLPYWAEFRSLAAIVFGLLAGVSWAGLELKWALQGRVGPSMRRMRRWVQAFR